MHQKPRTRKNTLLAAIFWSVIAAAFIGPGTVTTAASAGSQFGITLLWTVALSICATLVLQEAAARLSITTGVNIGGHLRARFKNIAWIPVLIWLAVAFGCAAYEAGNMLGAVAGLQLIYPGDTQLYTVIVFGIAIMLLRKGDPYRIAQVLGVLVAIMGLAFIVVATQTFRMGPDLLQIFTRPQLAPESALLIIGLVGTTIVPYNLFLGSRLGEGQDLGQMRRGLTIAVIFGGLITTSILFCGTLIEGAFDFASLSNTLEMRLGKWASYLFAAGLCAAGLTSTVTAPLAAAVTAQSIYPKWKSDTLPYRAVWMAVLCIGLVMGVSGFRPIPVILAAQAINGMLLPVVVFFLFVVAFSHQKESTYRPAFWHVGITWIILMVVTFLGLFSLITVLHRIGFVGIPEESGYLVAAILALVIGVVAWVVRQKQI